MLNVKDVNNNPVYLEDRVLYTDPETGCLIEAIVIAMFAEDDIQLCPIGEGTAFCVKPNTFEVTESFVADALAMQNDEAFQKVMARANAAYEKLIASGKKAPKKAKKNKEEAPEIEGL